MAACHSHGGLLATRFLLGAIRSELSSLLECHRQSMVSTSGTTYPCCYMVREKHLQNLIGKWEVAVRDRSSGTEVMPVV